MSQEEIAQMSNEILTLRKKLREIADLVHNRANSDWLPKHRVKEILERKTTDIGGSS